MISNALLWVLYVAILLFTLPLRALPDATLPDSITDALGSVGPAFGTIDAILPVDAILAALAVFLVVEAGIFLWKGLNWLVRKIPGVS